MEFGRWYPLSDAETQAPAAPGVLQVRVRVGLIDYPRGKSAMVHYQAADDLREAAGAVTAAHPGVDWLCRHLCDEPTAARALEERLRRGFVDRFGAPPTPP